MHILDARGPGLPAHAGRDRLIVSLAGGLLAVVAAALSVSYGRYALVIGLVFVVAAVILKQPERSLPALFALFILLGSVRRVVSDAVGSFPAFDTVLVIPSLAVVLLFMIAVQRGALRERTRLSSAVLALNGLALVGALNPLQGGIRAGVSGLFYDVLPVLWFWVGRELVSDAVLSRLFRTFMWLAAPVAIYGLLQSFGTFTPFDRAWMNHVGGGYVSLFVNGVARPFGTFASAAEYGLFLTIAIVCVAGLLIARRQEAWLGNVVVGVVVAIILGAAMFLSSLRGNTILAVIAVAVMFAAWKNLGVVRMTAVGALALMALVFGAGFAGGSGGSTGSPKQVGQAALVTHQVSGLSDPLSSKSSTLTLHLSEVVDAFKTALHNPIGHGTGYVHANSAGQAGAALTAPSTHPPSAPSATLRSSDSDVGNAAISWGILGIVVFAMIAIIGLRRGFTLARTERSWVALVVLGVLVAAAFRWLGEMYAAIPLVWLCLGWLDRKTSPRVAGVATAAMAIPAAP